MRPPASTRPGRRLDDPRDQAQQRRLAGAVAADEADGIAGLDRQRDVAQRLHLARAAAAARDEHVLQRALRLRVDAEGRETRSTTICARASCGDRAERAAHDLGEHAHEAGSSFGISIRSSRRPSSRALSCASVSMSQRISRWSETKPTGQTRTSSMPRAAQRRRGGRGCPGRATARRSATRSGTRTTSPRRPRCRRRARGLEQLVLVGVALVEDARGERVRREDDVSVRAADAVGEERDEARVVVPAVDEDDSARSATASSSSSR